MKAGVKRKLRVSAVEAGQDYFAAALEHGDGLVEDLGIAAGVEHGPPLAAFTVLGGGHFV
jgi:hypothetical protein